VQTGKFLFFFIIIIDGFEHLVTNKDKERTGDYHFSVDEDNPFLFETVDFPSPNATNLAEKKKKKKKKVMVKQFNNKINYCTFAIDRLNRGQSQNFARLSSTFANGTVRPFVDVDFPADGTSMYWQDYVSPKIIGELGRYRRIAWKRIQNIVKDKKCLNYFFGTQGINPFDIQQGMLGDCWLLSGLATLASREDRLTKIFMNKDIKYPADGLIGVRVRVLNRPMFITIDDFIPVISTRTMGDVPIFARGSADQDYWGALAEKAFAKLYGNYG
jgi:Calpain family cysteine protease